MLRIMPLCAAGLLAGTMNAVAGGGSFVAFPALVFAALPAVAANTSSTVALFPGTMASAWAWQRDLVVVGEIGFCWMLPVTVAGGLCGAVLLLATPVPMFDLVIPRLLLLAALTFAFGARVGRTLRLRLAWGRAACWRSSSCSPFMVDISAARSD